MSTVVINSESSITVIQTTTQVVEIQSSVGPAGVGVPAGGTAGQVLAKIDAADYNTEWVVPASGGGDSKTQARAFPSFWQFGLDTVFSLGSTTDIQEVPLTRIPIKEGKRYVVNIEFVGLGGNSNGIDMGIDSDVAFNGIISSLGSNTSANNVTSQLGAANTPPIITNFGFAKNNTLSNTVKTQGIINSPDADGEVWVIARNKVADAAQARISSLTFTVTEV